MRRVFSFLLIVALFFLSSCSNNPSPSIETTPTATPTIAFDTTVDNFLELLTSKNLHFKESNLIQYNNENDEKNLFGIIYVDDKKEDFIRIQIRSFHSNIFQVHVSYDVKDSSSENIIVVLPQLFEMIAKHLNPSIPNEFYQSLHERSTDYYSRDYENLRVTLTYSDESSRETKYKVEAIFVFLDPTD